MPQPLDAWGAYKKSQAYLQSFQRQERGEQSQRFYAALFPPLYKIKQPSMPNWMRWWGTQLRNGFAGILLWLLSEVRGYMCIPKYSMSVSFPELYQGNIHILKYFCSHLHSCRRTNEDAEKIIQQQDRHQLVNVSVLYSKASKSWRT